MGPMSRMPRVAVSVCLDRGQRRPGRDYLYVSRAYSSALSSAGLLPLLVGPDSDELALIHACDGVVLTGGDDLPRSFAQGAKTEALPGPAEDAERINWERRLLDACDAKAVPVLGICYGMQLMNLHFGGSLHVHLSHEVPQALDHGGGGALTHHDLKWGDSPWLGGLQLQRVNSSHRQAVAEVAPGFSPSAFAPDGTVEAIERATFLGVQWHPETDPSGPALFKRFATFLADRG